MIPLKKKLVNWPHHLSKNLTGGESELAKPGLVSTPRTEKLVNWPQEPSKKLTRGESQLDKPDYVRIPCTEKLVNWPQDSLKNSTGEEFELASYDSVAKYLQEVCCEKEPILEGRGCKERSTPSLLGKFHRKYFVLYDRVLLYYDDRLEYLRDKKHGLVRNVAS